MPQQQQPQHFFLNPHKQLDLERITKTAFTANRTAESRPSWSCRHFCCMGQKSMAPMKPKPPLVWPPNRKNVCNDPPPLQSTREAKKKKLELEKKFVFVNSIRGEKKHKTMAHSSSLSLSRNSVCGSLSLICRAGTGVLPIRSIRPVRAQNTHTQQQQQSIVSIRVVVVREYKGGLYTNKNIEKRETAHVTSLDEVNRPSSAAMRSMSL